MFSTLVSQSRMTMDLKKFKLRDAIEIFLDPKCPVFFRTWVLARLMAWMCLDQRRGTRKRTPQTVRTRDAKLAGHLALASLLDRRWQPGEFDKNDKTLQGLLLLFFTSGSFRLFMETPRGARGWLSRMGRSTQQLFYVHQIVRYLCRYEKSGMDQSKFNIECAKKFIWKTKETPEPRTLGKYWETNKRAAPYIFAFYPFLVSAVERATSIDQFVDALEQLAIDQGLLIKFVGHAAFAADILAERARKVRVRDFLRVERVEPPLEAFTAEEAQIVSLIEAQREESKKALE